MEELVGRVASVLSECAQYSNDSTNLDRLCFLLRGVSSEIGSLLDEILVTRQRNVESGELIKLNYSSTSSEPGTFVRQVLNRNLCSKSSELGLHEKF